MIKSEKEYLVSVFKQPIRRHKTKMLNAIKDPNPVQDYRNQMDAKSFRFKDIRDKVRNKLDERLKNRPDSTTVYLEIHTLDLFDLSASHQRKVRVAEEKRARADQFVQEANDAIEHLVTKVMIGEGSSDMITEAHTIIRKIASKFKP